MVDWANRFIKSALVVAGVTDLEPCHGDVIAALLERDGRHLSDITQATHRTKPTLTVLVNHLEANGYVRRKPSKTDARVAEIWLTAKCRRLIPLFLDISARMAAEITKNLMADETKELDRLLVKVISQPTKETSK
jgi:DNA-binding MarR family transcriptional regulator